MRVRKCRVNFQLHKTYIKHKLCVYIHEVYLQTQLLDSRKLDSNFSTRFVHRTPGKSKLKNTGSIYSYKICFILSFIMPALCSLCNCVLSFFRCFVFPAFILSYNAPFEMVLLAFGQSSAFSVISGFCSTLKSLHEDMLLEI